MFTCQYKYTNFTLLVDQSINNVNMFTRLTAQYAKQQREGGGEGRGDLGYLRGTVYTGADDLDAQLVMTFTQIQD